MERDEYRGIGGRWFGSLTFEVNADNMSALKVFTVRELDREPSAVLDECDRHGGVKIRRRDGRTYTVRPDIEPGRITKTPDIAGRVKRLFPKPIDPAHTRLVDKLLAGE